VLNCILLTAFEVAGYDDIEWQCWFHQLLDSEFFQWEREQQQQVEHELGSRRCEMIG